MNKKNLISLTIAISFLALSITGILLFIKQKAHFVEITHTVVGLLFVGFAIFILLIIGLPLEDIPKNAKLVKSRRNLFLQVL